MAIQKIDEFSIFAKDDNDAKDAIVKLMHDRGKNKLEELSKAKLKNVFTKLKSELESKLNHIFPKISFPWIEKVHSKCFHEIEKAFESIDSKNYVVEFSGTISNVVSIQPISFSTALLNEDCILKQELLDNEDILKCYLLDKHLISCLKDIASKKDKVERLEAHLIKDGNKLKELEGQEDIENSKIEVLKTNIANTETNILEKTQSIVCSKDNILSKLGSIETYLDSVDESIKNDLAKQLSEIIQNSLTPITTSHNFEVTAKILSIDRLINKKIRNDERTKKINRLKSILKKYSMPLISIGVIGIAGNIVLKRDPYESAKNEKVTNNPIDFGKLVIPNVSLSPEDEKDTNDFRYELLNNPAYKRMLNLQSNNKVVKFINNAKNMAQLRALIVQNAGPIKNKVEDELSQIYSKQSPLSFNLSPKSNLAYFTISEVSQKIVKDYYSNDSLIKIKRMYLTPANGKTYVASRPDEIINNSGRTLRLDSSQYVLSLEQVCNGSFTFDIQSVIKLPGKLDVESTFNVNTESLKSQLREKGLCK